MSDLAGIRAALERIATVLEQLAAAPAPGTGEPPSCVHPVESRIDFGYTKGQQDFECGVCGFRSVPQEV